MPKMAEVMTQVEYLTEETIMKAIVNHSGIDKYVYILHDKDVYTEEDEKKDATHKAGTLKAPHWHVFLKFKYSYQFKDIANWFGVPVNFVNKIETNFLNGIKYATHMNAPEKYQYNASECKANFEYAKFIKNSEQQEQKSNRKTEIQNLILGGKIEEYNYFEILTPQECLKYKTAIKDAFELVNLIESKKINRNMDVVYVHGASGTGKTTFAKMYAEHLGYKPFICSSSNDPFDGYSGEKCVVFDDVMVSNAYFSDILKMLDNHTNATIKSRYKNKVLSKCELMIISTVDTINDFYKSTYKRANEPITQLKRRCQTYIEFTHEIIYVYVYDDAKEEYEFVGKYKNDILSRLPAEDKKSIEEKKENAHKALNGMNFKKFS